MLCRRVCLCGDAPGASGAAVRGAGTVLGAAGMAGLAAAGAGRGALGPLALPGQL